MFPVAAELSPEQLEKARLLRALKQWRARRDYKFFLDEVLGYAHIPGFWQYKDPTLQYLIAEVGRLLKDWKDNRHTQQTYRKFMFIWPRGTGKSACVTKPAVIDALLDNPDLVAGVMSATYEDMAVKFTASIKKILEGEDENARMKSLMGLDFHSPGSNRKWTDERFTVDIRSNTGITDPTVSAFSAAKGPTSGHFNLFIVDDPVTKEAMSKDARWLDKIWDSYLQLPAVINRDGLLILINTRYHDADLCGRIINEEIKPEVERVMGGLPSDWDEETGWIQYAHLAGWDVLYEQVYENYGTKDQKLRFPVIWTEELIREAQKGGGKGDLFFWTQLMNQPQKRADNPITPIHIRTALGSPEPWRLDEAPRTGTVNIYCDFAFKDAEAYAEQRGDYTVAHVVSQRDGFVWRVHGYRGKPTQDMFGEELIRLAMWAKNEFDARIGYLTFDRITWQGSGDESTQKWLESLFRRCPSLNMPAIIPVKRTKKKEQFILGTAWAWQEGWVRLVEGAPGNDELCYQMSRIGQTSHDDDADSFATAFQEQFYQVNAKAGGASKWEWESAVDYMYDGVDEEFEYGRF